MRNKHQRKERGPNDRIKCECRLGSLAFGSQYQIRRRTNRRTAIDTNALRLHLPRTETLNTLAKHRPDRHTAYIYTSCRYPVSCCELPNKLNARNVVTFVWLLNANSQLPSCAKYFQPDLLIRRMNPLQAWTRAWNCFANDWGASFNTI